MRPVQNVIVTISPNVFLVSSTIARPNTVTGLEGNRAGGSFTTTNESTAQSCAVGSAAEQRPVYRRALGLWR